MSTVYTPIRWCVEAVEVSSSSTFRSILLNLELG